jgi:cytochrome c oxidase assembly protein subunit 15
LAVREPAGGFKRAAGPPADGAVALWLALVALLVFIMVVVGGATRLTDSGLSITEWRPVTGAVPPLTDAGWAAEFEKYRRIPEYRFVNAGMSLAEFKTIFWWEWGHRFLGRVIGLAFAVPFLVFLIARRIPQGLIGRCWLLLALGGLQGAVGWWMVSSGLSERVDVAPERLTTHLGLALVLFGVLIWTALDAWKGTAAAPRRQAAAWAAYGLFGLVFVQCLLGGLVAGNDAGRVYTDWPLMGGRLFPAEYGDAGGLWWTLVHDHAAVQLHHRLGGYLLFAGCMGLSSLDRRPGRRPLQCGGRRPPGGSGHGTDAPWGRHPDHGGPRRPRNPPPGGRRHHLRRGCGAGLDGGQGARA